MCVAPTTHVGAWSMAVLLGQPFEYYYYHKGAIAPLYNYRDGTGWPASLPYIRKIYVSMAIGTQSGIRLHERVPMVKKWGSSKND